MAMDRYLVVEPWTRVGSGQRKRRWPVMRSHHIGLCGLCGLCLLVAAALVGGALAFGVPASSLWILALVVACPLMMIVMMRGMHSGSSNDTGQLKNEHDEQVRRL
jgi:cobalamin synthase